MEYLAQIKEILKILGGILALSTTPEGLAKGLAIFALVFIAVTMWKLLCEFRGWREIQSCLAKDVKRLTVDTNFLVEKHCKQFEKDAFDLMKLRDQGSAAAEK